VVFAAVAAAVLVVASAAATVSNQGLGIYIYLLPSLTVLALCPLVVQLAPRRWVYTIASAAVLCWLLLANVVRPRAFDEGSAAAMTVLGVLLVLSGVLLLSHNQQLLTLPLLPLGGRSPHAAVAGRLALAYPAARPFRTGAIITMYALVMFMLVLIMVFGHLVAAGARSELRNAFGGFGIRVDWRPSARLADPRQALASGRFAHRVDLVAPLTVASAELSDGTQAAALGVAPALLSAATFPLDRRLESLDDDRAAWQTVLSGGSGYAIVAPRPGAASPGTVITLHDPATGRVVRQVTVAGVLRDGAAFRGAGETRGSPLIMSAAAVRSAFGAGARASSALVRPTAAADVRTLLADLQGEFLAEGLVGLDARQHVEREIAADQAFFQLLRGFVALGLAVGIAGLAVVMARAVRDRRQQIGVLRALGFPRRMVLASLLGESLVVALQGILLGTILSLVTGYQLFRSQPALRRTGIAFTVPWLEVAGLVVAVAALSLLVSAWPARRALRLHPAIVLRVRD
jgi:putative ABC transport system permease protein